MILKYNARLTRHSFHLRLVVIECPCCPEDNRRVFVGRRDNFMTHLALHITGERRVPFHPKAAEIWEEEKQKSRPRAPSSRARSRNDTSSLSEDPDMDECPLISRKRTAVKMEMD